MGSFGRWQLLGRHALDLAMAIGIYDHALERDFGTQVTVRFGGSEA
jgi:hypothetical protein